jgi:hypothetical protein
VLSAAGEKSKASAKQQSGDMQVDSGHEDFQGVACVAISTVSVASFPVGTYSMNSANRAETMPILKNLLWEESR